MSSSYLIFCGICVTIIKELNAIVVEPYMDEPFHIPQAQAYCRGEFSTWDPKITTPPGLYLWSWLLKHLFLFKCNVPMLRLTPLLSLLSLPIVLTRLLCYHKRERPVHSILSPSLEAIVLSAFPIAWFFGFLYYTEVPSVLFVVCTVVAASQGKHWIGALTNKHSLGVIRICIEPVNVPTVPARISGPTTSTNASRSTLPRRQPKYGVMTIREDLGDLPRSFLSVVKVLPDILPAFVPYMLVLATFAVFVIWNGGIVLGDKSNHIPVLHIPQLYYFIAFTTFFGWPVLISTPDGILGLARGVWSCMFGNRTRALVTLILWFTMGMTVKLFTIHHPFLLSDNRHYTFYVWRRVYLVHPMMPYALVPVYLACAWAWWLRVGPDQTLLQSLLLPIFVIPTLLPTPLLEPRYFLMPYILLRSQVTKVPLRNVVLEGIWYGIINAITMGVFLYLPREGVGRFMW